MVIRVRRSRIVRAVVAAAPAEIAARAAMDVVVAVEAADAIVVRGAMHVVVAAVDEIAVRGVMIARDKARRWMRRLVKLNSKHNIINGKRVNLKVNSKANPRASLKVIVTVDAADVTRAAAAAVNTGRAKIRLATDNLEMDNSVTGNRARMDNNATIEVVAAETAIVVVTTATIAADKANNVKVRAVDNIVIVAAGKIATPVADNVPRVNQCRLRPLESAPR